VRDPFDPDRRMDYLAVPKGAVCTSGNYARHVEIDGIRYSHIVDPRTGRPADRVPSATVIAPSATVADAWATALSVLGPAGLDKLPDGVEAMLVTGTPTHYQVHATEGYRRLRAAFREAAASE
jgi:thiamine biosynthesis lipoprotein ApbE